MEEEAQTSHHEQKPEEQKANWWTKFKAYVQECRRVLRVTKKPNSDELKTIVKVSGLGMIIIGLIGFIISAVKQLLFK